MDLLCFPPSRLWKSLKGLKCRGGVGVRSGARVGPDGREKRVGVGGPGKGRESRDQGEV